MIDQSRIDSRVKRAAEIESRWWEIHHNGGKWIFPEAKATWKRLRALKELTPDAVNQAIGSTAWTDCYCSDCQRAVEVVIRVGDEPNEERETAYLCIDCVRAALAVFEEARHLRPA